MMKLKHLFDNPVLAEMLLKNWEYDASSLELFQYFRISANAIYPFRQQGEICFLRCCPTSEKQKENILAELDFLGYLHSKQFPALEPVPAKSEELLVQKCTPWGEYFASVFKRVPGAQISESGFEDEILFAYGAALGQLHKLSSEYTAPKARRWSHVDVFNWIDETLNGLELDNSSLEELNLLKETFATLPIHPGNYGLIHYDFEPDNVFYDPVTKSCSAIDFDDAMYHWYVMDLVQALGSLKDEIDASEYLPKQAVFLAGYRSKYEIDNRIFAAIPLFERFVNLYGYTRVARSIQEQWENEPEWLVELRVKLARSLVNKAKYFGKPVDEPPRS